MKLLRGLLRLMAAGNVLAIVALVLPLDGPGTRRFEVAPSALPVGQPSTELRIQAVSVTVEHPTAGQTVLDLLAGPLPFALATLPMIWYALRLLDRIADTQEPFTGAVAAGLRRLGVIVLVAAGSAEVIRTTGLYLLESTVVPPGERMVLLDLTPSSWWVVLALVLFAFAQIIGYGRRLRAELDEVI